MDITVPAERLDAFARAQPRGLARMRRGAVQPAAVGNGFSLGGQAGWRAGAEAGAPADARARIGQANADRAAASGAGDIAAWQTDNAGIVPAGADLWRGIAPDDEGRDAPPDNSQGARAALHWEGELFYGASWPAPGDAADGPGHVIGSLRINLEF